MLIELTDHERNLLLDLLSLELSELQPEIRRTSEWEYRGSLRDRRELARHLNDRLREQIPVAIP